MEPSMRLLAVCMAAAVALGPIALPHGAAQPDGSDSASGWHWEQALDLQDRDRLDADNGPILAAADGRLVAAPAPWSDDGVLRAEAFLFEMRSGRLAETGRLAVAVPDAPAGAPAAGTVSVAANGPHAALGLVGHGAGSGVVHVAGTASATIDAPAEAVGFGRSLAISAELLAVGTLGRVHVYSHGADGWMPFQVLEGGPGSGFGTAIAFADGVLAVGAPATGGGVGEVQVFHLTAKGLAQVAAVPGPATDRDFGFDVAVHEGAVFALGRTSELVRVHRLGPTSDGWGATAKWNAGATGSLSSLDVHDGLVAVVSPDGIRSFAHDGPGFHHEPVTDQLVVGPRFGRDAAFLGDALVVSDPSDRIHVFQQGTPCTNCPPPPCDDCAEPEPVAAGPLSVALVPGTPWTDSPHPGVAVTYNVSAPALLAHTATVSGRAPTGLPAVPGNEEAPGLTNYLVVHVHRFEATGNTSPEPRIRIDMEVDAPPGVDPSRAALFFFDGRQWVNLMDVPPGTAVPATTPEGDLVVYGAGIDPDGGVWAVVDHTSAYAVGLRPMTAVPGAADTPLMEGPWVFIGVLTFLVGGVWVTNAIIGAGRLPQGSRRKRTTDADPSPPAAGAGRRPR